MLVLKAVIKKILAIVFSGMTMSEIFDLFLPTRQSAFVQRRRSLLILSRVRLVALTFAVLTPLWIPVDLVIFETTLAMYLAALRVMASIAFVLLALSFRGSDSVTVARWGLIWLLTIPTVFFLISHPLLAQFAINDPAQQVIAAGYAFLPFVMVAGLSVFPITALEGALLGLPLILAYFLTGVLGYQLLPFASHLGAQWLLLLLAMVATLAGMSQLHFMSQLVDQSSHDGLTRAYNRRVGEEMLVQQFVTAARSKIPLSLAFVDLDNFKSINDKYGHEEGDNALRIASTSLRKVLRRGDILIRWGGEEFIAVMPNTDPPGAAIAIARLRSAGLGMRPDGLPLTASVGVAERITDGIETWNELVERADQRMYAAKQSGKNRVIGCGDKVLAETAASEAV
ncbi:GGDEF domain-contatining protein [Paramagnetospirillum magnetotacticum MS-1]|uniref:diguanylate cyclase n=1 Tax=Paramagnetospirillum magnetotacticum MS-1 TaxID=272627 RepID=A0A0C2YUG2_PARME|nr:diguanylate cyclase [Paramagnetospirillum magnetotacticum]KIL98345.1 GGDEF domain-contatining protein [Paramagnetospirillum magnetotacticum MS-1]